MPDPRVETTLRQLINRVIEVGNEIASAILDTPIPWWDRFVTAMGWFAIVLVIMILALWVRNAVEDWSASQKERRRGTKNDS